MHLLLGGVLLLPYLGLAALFFQSFRVDAAARGGLALLLLVAVVVSVVIALIPAVRVLEVAAARSLLEVALPEQTLEGSRAWGALARRRLVRAQPGAGWCGGAGHAVRAADQRGAVQAPITGLEPVRLGATTVRLDAGWATW